MFTSDSLFKLSSYVLLLFKINSYNKDNDYTDLYLESIIIYFVLKSDY